MTAHLILIDSSGFAYRAHYAMPVQRRASDGMETHAVTGYMSMVYHMLGRAESDPPNYAAAVFDHPGKTFRHRAYPAYKANRQRPESLTTQLAMMREASRCLGIEPLELKGYEADDVIATLAHRAKIAGIRTTIVSIDKDMMQLVEDGVIEIADPVKRKHVTSADVVEKFGVMPAQVPDIQALIGDSADNIPGVKGVGGKIASNLFRQYRTLDNILKAIDYAGAMVAKPAVRAALKRQRKDIALYRKLVTLSRDVPIEVELSTLAPQPVQRGHLAEMLRALECPHLLDRLFPLPSGKMMFRRAEPVKDPFAWWQKELTHRGRGQLIPPVPQCGYYKRRLVQGADWVVARIWREEDIDRVTGTRSKMEKVLCEVNGERADPDSHWGYLLQHPITEEEYRQRAKNPPPNPRTAIDWNREPV